MARAVWRFLVPAAWLLLVLVTCAAAAAAGDDDVLLEVKSAFVEDPEGVLEDWLGDGGSSGFCSWAGVACDAAGLRVVGLNLSGAGLVGPVPGALARHALEVIDLSSNRLAGPVLAALGRLGRLWARMLYSNQLAGEIPASLSRLAALQVLLLGDNLGLSWPIPDALRELRNLTVLGLASSTSPERSRGVLGGSPRSRP